MSKLCLSIIISSRLKSFVGQSFFFFTIYFLYNKKIFFYRNWQHSQVTPPPSPPRPPPFPDQVRRRLRHPLPHCRLLSIYTLLVHATPTFYLPSQLANAIILLPNSIQICLIVSQILTSISGSFEIWLFKVAFLSI